jgi:hypothetical protein
VRVSVLVMTAFAVACSADHFTELEPRLRLCAPGGSCGEVLALGAFRTGVPHATRVILRNEGEGDLFVHGASLVGSDQLVLGEVPERVDGLSDADLGLELTPLDGEGQAEITVESNDPKHDALKAFVHFSGVAPDLVLCPIAPTTADPACVTDLHVALGEVRPMQAADARVEVRNSGTQDLTLAGASLSDTASVAGEFSILTSTATGVIRAGESSPLVVRYTPLDGINDEVTITVAPVDETLPAVTLVLNGGAPANAPPEAVAVEYGSAASPVVGEAGVGVWLDGRSSADPEGDPLSFAWTVVAQPPGSTAALETPSAGVTRFVPDVLGNYIVQLTVTDSLALVDFADVTVQAGAHEMLRADLSWGVNAGDVDLHLVPTGAAVFSDADCSFVHPLVDLGTVGEAHDDAELLADSESGDGHERIAIRRPSDGTYEVWAHYFDSRGGRTAAAEISITADDGSVVLGSTTTNLTTTCELWFAGTIAWPARTFSPASTPHTFQCYAVTP